MADVLIFSTLEWLKQLKTRAKTSCTLHRYIRGQGQLITASHP